MVLQLRDGQQDGEDKTRTKLESVRNHNPSTMKLLVNQYEQITHARLLDACADQGAHVCPKVRVKDALPLEGSGVTREQFTYALQSHFDFVVADKDSTVLFAVEFDGPNHRSADAQRRDGLKNELCRRFGLPLLRINSNHIERKFRQWDLLTYFIDTWFLKRAFEEAQSQGTVPWEEDFDPMNFITDGKDGRWRYWFSAPSQIAIQRLHKAGQIRHASASHLSGYDVDDNLRCLAFIKVTDQTWVSTTTGMRSQLFDVCTSDVLWQIGIVDVHDRLIQALAGKAPFVNREEMERAVEEFDYAYKASSWGGIMEAPLTRMRRGIN